MMQPEPWLRGPVVGISPALQPVAHAFIMALEDSTAAVSSLAGEELWRRPGGAASAGFHLVHLAGSTDRLLTYARGESLSETQRAELAAEASVDDRRPPLDEMLATWRQTVDRALAQLAATLESTLSQQRYVGRARLPSTAMGLLFHAAEHAQRHTGQLVTTAKVVRG